MTAHFIYHFHKWLFVRHWLTNSHAQSIKSETGKIPLLLGGVFNLYVMVSSGSSSGWLKKVCPWFCCVLSSLKCFRKSMSETPNFK